MSEADPYRDDLPPAREPAFNVPGVIAAVCAALIAVHVAMGFLSPDWSIWVLEVFAFIPLRYAVEAERLIVPLSRLWSPVSYFALHADWQHLITNLIWFLAFGSVVARRFGAVRFLAFLAASSAAAALAHYLTNIDSAVPVVGASGGVSACMGAAVRYGFSPNERGPGVPMRPRLSLVQAFSNPTMLAFVAFWFFLNWLFGAGIVALPGVEGQIAWEAHVGGFLFGLLALAPFDPWRRRGAQLER